MTVNSFSVILISCVLVCGCEDRTIPNCTTSRQMNAHLAECHPHEYLRLPEISAHTSNHYVRNPIDLNLNTHDLNLSNDLMSAVNFDELTLSVTYELDWDREHFTLASSGGRSDRQEVSYTTDLGYHVTLDVLLWTRYRRVST